MKKAFLLLAMATVAFASCTKSDVSPTPSRVVNNLGASVKAKPVTPAPGAPAAGGGGGNGGGNAPSSNLAIYTKQLTAGWQAFIGSGEPVPGIPGATGTITILITFKADGTFTLVSVDNVTKAQITASGTWQFTIPSNLPINESGVLVLNSGGKTLMSGLLLFVHPGIIKYQTSVNNLDKTLVLSTYVFQKA